METRPKADRLLTNRRRESQTHPMKKTKYHLQHGTTCTAKPRGSAPRGVRRSRSAGRGGARDDGGDLESRERARRRQQKAPRAAAASIRETHERKTLGGSRKTRDPHPRLTPLSHRRRRASIQSQRIRRVPGEKRRASIQSQRIDAFTPKETRL